MAGHEVTDEGEEGAGWNHRWLIRLRRGAVGRILAEQWPEADSVPNLRGGRFQTTDWRAGIGPAPSVANPLAGFVPLGAATEAGAPPFDWRLNRQAGLWSPDVAQLVDGAAAAQWDATRDIPWADIGSLPDFLERAVCQVVTYLAQNEYVAYYVPARFMSAVHPEYAEVLMWLASHVYDEARHIEVFTKRALITRSRGYALAATQRSLHALLQERDFTACALLLNVLGEGSFLDLLDFVATYAPDAATATAARLAHRDELRHVHFGIGHVWMTLESDPGSRSRLLAAAEDRAARLTDVTGLSPVVVEALGIMAAGSLQPAQLSEGAAAVKGLMRRMAENRVRRLREAGLDEAAARHVADLHTPNLM